MIVQGKAKWAKVVGAPQPGYDKTKKEWSIDLVVDEAAVEKLEAEGLGPKIKTNKDGETYITFKRPAVRADGTNAKPIEIKDKNLQPWDNRKIGNGSTVNIKFVVNETEYNKKKFKKPGIIAIQVVDLVDYEGGDFEDFSAADGSGESWS